MFNCLKAKQHSVSHFYYSVRNRARDDDGYGIVAQALGPKIDKIFSTYWLDDDMVLFGTKCGMLFSYKAAKEEVNNIVEFVCQNESQAQAMEYALLNNEASTINNSKRFIIGDPRYSNKILCSGKSENRISVFNFENSELSFEREIQIGKRCYPILSATYCDDVILFGGADGLLYCASINRLDNPTLLHASNEQPRQIVSVSATNSACILLGHSQLLSLDLCTGGSEIHSIPQSSSQSDFDCIAASQCNVFAGGRREISMLDNRSSKEFQRIWTVDNCISPDAYHRIMGPACMKVGGEHHLIAGLSSGQVVLFEQRMNRFASFHLDFSASLSFASVFALEFAPNQARLAVAGGPHYEEFFGNFFALIE